MQKLFSKFCYYLFTFPRYKLLFAHIGNSSRLKNPKVDGFKNISIGSGVFIEQGTWLAALPLVQSINCKLIVSDGTYIGRFGHIYATAGIEIGEKVLIADKVYISDNLHSFENIQLPVLNQPVKQLKQVKIGAGAWIGENACIIGASIGKNSVVGANAVVTKDIPDFCVATGIPAIIIKKYNFETKQWHKTNSEGNFI
ncbi:MAG: acyltransferase [Ferruginibacter sp.]|mgnify:CR=1 FL=1|nr:acyltransferase [Ferruginibacter sp.]MBP9135845.1 acyltransferase [Chitinophagales bacterium]